MEIVLIVEKSEVFSDFIKGNYLEKWKVPIGEVKPIEKLSDAAGVTLFGDNVPSLITLNTPTQVKEFIKEFEALEKIDEIESFKNSGLIIVANIGRQSTRRLENLIKKHGTVEITNNKISLSKQLVDKTNLPAEVKTFLLDYVGEDYENLVPLIKILLKSPKSSHKNVSIEDVYIRLPKPPGAVPPWEIERPLLQKDLSKVIDVFRRINRSSHYLVVLAMLKNKFILAYRIAALLEVNPRITDEELTKRLGIANNYYYKKTKEISLKQGRKNLEKIMELITNTESNVKGGRNVAGDLQMEVMLIRLVQTIN